MFSPVALICTPLTTYFKHYSELCHILTYCNLFLNTRILQLPGWHPYILVYDQVLFFCARLPLELRSLFHDQRADGRNVIFVWRG